MVAGDKNDEPGEDTNPIGDSQTHIIESQVDGSQPVEEWIQKYGIEE